MKTVLFLVLVFFTAAAGAQQKKQECFTRNIPAGFLCHGGASPHDVAATIIPGAPNPAYLVRGCMANQGAPAPAGGFGLWSIGVDRGSDYYNASGYPATQNGPLDRMATVAMLDLAPGLPRSHCEPLEPPVKWVEGQDRLVLNFDCTGNFYAYPTFTVCWQVTE